MALFVKNPEVDALAQELTSVKRTTKTEAVRLALRGEIERETGQLDLVARSIAFARGMRERAGPNPQPVDKAFRDGLSREPDAPGLVARLPQARQRLTSPLSIRETTIALARVLDLPLPEAQQAVRDDLALASIQAVAVSPKAADSAIEAFDRYGKGRHPAGLNFGDCYAYAYARSYRMPLLFKDNDFALTDISAT